MSNKNLQQQLLDNIEAGLNGIDLPAQPETLYDPYRYALSVGGKRIRPMLTLLACGLCDGDVDEAMPAALAIEILHNFTLVHDDIMDSANTRRGKPSIFSKWDTNVAILSGDVMFADAYQKLSYYGHSSNFTKEEFASIHDIFVKTIVTVCEGQALDMEFVNRKNVSRQEYINMISGKTSALLSGALEMGAMVAHASPQERKLLGELGQELGIAFQIQDDLLDATADPEKFGKRPGGDIFEGKKTYLTILALEHANENQKTKLQHALYSGQVAEQDVNEVLGIMKELKVIDDVSSQVKVHYKKAENLLNSFKNSDYKKELQNLLIFLQNRDH